MCMGIGLMWAAQAYFTLELHEVSLSIGHENQLGIDFDS